MGQPKRKQSKQRSRKRRGANSFAWPNFSKDPADGGMHLSHHVNPRTGMYRDRPVLDIEV
ncbi:MAG: 50S ribosomal protein L32 [Puniceicoccales bacterium]|nr:50S ribosomal protein L32 [Puniceicoccales bacterium]